MPSIGNITANDDKSTPVLHTFEPAKTSADMATWEDRAATQYIGYNKLTTLLRRPTGPSRVANRNLHVVVRLETPVLETLGTADSGLQPAPTVAYRLVCEATFTLPERSSLQERKDLLKLFYNILNTSQVSGVIHNFSVPY